MVIEVNKTTNNPIETVNTLVELSSLIGSLTLSQICENLEYEIHVDIHPVKYEPNTEL